MKIHKLRSGANTAEYLHPRGGGCASAVIAVPVPSSTFVKSHEKLKGSSLDTGLRVVRGGRGRAGQLAGGGQRAALGDGEDARRGKGEGGGAGKVHSVQT